MQTLQKHKSHRIGRSFKDTLRGVVKNEGNGTQRIVTSTSNEKNRTSTQYPNCTVTEIQNLGDGRCNNYGNFNSFECGFDAGDCIEFNEKYPNCTASSPDMFLGNGYCSTEYNTEECGFDGGDCIEFNQKYPNCTAPHPVWIGNGRCSDYPPYNTEECGFDGGDCSENCFGVWCSTTEEKAIVGVVLVFTGFILCVVGYRHRRHVINALSYFTSSMLRKK